MQGVWTYQIYRKPGNAFVHEACGFLSHIDAWDAAVFYITNVLNDVVSNYNICLSRECGF